MADDVTPTVDEVPTGEAEEYYLVSLQFTARPVGRDGMVNPDAIRVVMDWPPMSGTALIGVEVALHRLNADLLRLGARRALVREHDPTKRAFLEMVCRDGPTAALAAAVGGGESDG